MILNRWLYVVVALCAAVVLGVPRVAFAQNAEDAGVAATDAGANTGLLPPPPPPVAAVQAPPDNTSSSGGGGLLNKSGLAGGEPKLNENSGELTGTPNPSALAPSSSNELRFSTHGYFRAPLRIGVGSVPACPAGAAPGTAEPVPGNSVGAMAPCAGAGSSTTNFHTPQVPDDQYLDWRYTRQLEKDWTEVFLNFGNSIAVATVGFQAYNFSDASFNNESAQLGIAQGYVTITPDFGRKDLRLSWKVGAFWEKFGQAGKYDAGKYDTYMFGRTHLYGETVAAEYEYKDFTFRLSQGVGAKPEQDLSAATGAGQFPPGFTLITHEHAGVSYKKWLDVNFHDIYAFSQDSRVPSGDGNMNVIGAEAHLWGGIVGDLYFAYSHIDANHVQAVGPGVEVVHSLGGGYAGGTLGGSANGLIENYLGGCGTCASQSLLGTGAIDTVEFQYDYSFGFLARKLKNPNIAGFWGDGWDVNLSLFGMITSVTTYDVTMPTQKLKLGADLVVRPIKWFGFGVRFDDVQPSNLAGGDHQSFAVLSPKIMFRSSFISHEEITLQYTHYFYGDQVTTTSPFTPTTPVDADAFGAKATVWW